MPCCRPPLDSFLHAAHCLGRIDDLRARSAFSRAYLSLSAAGDDRAEHQPEHDRDTTSDGNSCQGIGQEYARGDAENCSDRDRQSNVCRSGPRAADRGSFSRRIEMDVRSIPEDRSREYPCRRFPRHGPRTDCRGFQSMPCSSISCRCCLSFLPRGFPATVWRRDLPG